MVSLRESGAPAVPTVEHSPGGLVCEPPEPSPPSLVLSDRSPVGAGLRHPVPTMDVAVTLRLPPNTTTRTNMVKIREDQADKIVIAPSCPRRSWYHLFLQMACKIPLLLPCRRNLLSHCLPDKGTLFHTDLKTLRLTVWKLSSVPSRVKAF